MASVRWHDFVPVPLLPGIEFSQSDREQDDYLQLLISIGAGYAGYQFSIAPYSNPSAGLALMRLTYASPYLAIGLVAAQSAVTETENIRIIATNESTTSWWKALVLGKGWD